MDYEKMGRELAASIAMDIRGKVEPEHGIALVVQALERAALEGELRAFRKCHANGRKGNRHGIYSVDYEEKQIATLRARLAELKEGGK